MTIETHTQAPSDTLPARAAQQLSYLGRDSRLLTDGALAALRDECGGSQERLRTVLKCALFLASTDDSPTLDASHIERAAAMQPAPTATPVARPPRVRPVRRLAFGPARGQRLLPPVPDEPGGHVAGSRVTAVAALLMAAAALIVPRSISEPPAPLPVHDATPSIALAPGRAPNAVERFPVALPSTPERPPPLPPHALAPMPPAQFVPEIPVALPPLPDRAVPLVAIKYTRSDPSAESRAEEVASVLRQRAVPVIGLSATSERVAPTIAYYYTEDRANAERIEAMLTPEWQARMRPLDDHRAGTPGPGTVHIFVP